MYSIDVIIAALNEEKHLAKCLDSLMQQNYPASLVQIYLVDNGSTDKTIEIAKGYPVTILRQVKQGAASARNYGAHQGAGTLMAFIDAHCILDANWLSSMSKPFQDNTVGGSQGSIEFVYTNVRQSGKRTNLPAENQLPFHQITISGTKDPYPWLLGGNAMLHRGIFESVGGLDESICGCEDVDYSWKLVLNGYRLVSVPEALIIHYEEYDWWQFSKKYYRYGKSVGQICQRYQIGSHRLFSFSESLLSSGLFGHSMMYWLGFNTEWLRSRLFRSPTMQPFLYQPIPEERRPQFYWEPGIMLSISPHIVFWQRDEQATIIIDASRTQRILLEDSAHHIWQALSQNQPKSDIINLLASLYQDLDATMDLDQFIQELIDAQLVIPYNSETSQSGATVYNEIIPTD